MHMATHEVSNFVPLRGETKARLRRCFKEDPFKEGILEEFCEETSMHGFKFLLPQYEPLMRRTVWFLVLTTFTIITIYQLSVQISYFLNNPLAVNIEREFPKTIDFPVVILCNTMPFRVSKVHPKSTMHKAISALYHTPKLNVSAAEEYRSMLESITNTTEYLTHVAFDKRDMIVRCLWKDSEECSHEDFETYQLDNRICYAFNTGKNGKPIRSVSQAGEANGLELTLNSERYEEMDGPYSTHAILVGLTSQKSSASVSSTIYTMLGASTKIGIQQAEVEYYKGLTCNEKPLKYFPVYSRYSCVMEKRIDTAVQNCKCFPFTVSDDYVARNGTMKKCNLFEHFHCSLNTLAEVPTFNNEECPQECHTVSYNPTVSQSVMSWSGLKAQFWEQYSVEQDILGSLTYAMESDARYDVHANEKYLVKFENIRKETQQMLDVMNGVNSLMELHTSHELDLPPALPDLPVSDSIDEFEHEMLSEKNGIIPSLERNIEVLQTTISKMKSVLYNDSLAPYLFLKREVGNVTINKKDLPAKLLVASGGSVFLQLFADWTKAVLSIDTLNIEIDFAAKYVSVPRAWAKILTNTETAYIVGIQNNLNTVTFVKNSINDRNGCFHKDLFNFTDNEGQEISISITEAFTCVLHHFAGPSAKQALSETLPLVLSFIEPELEVDSQTRECTTVLCTLVTGEHNSDCDLHDFNFKSGVKTLLDEVQPLIEGCSNTVKNSKMGIEQFIDNFRNTTMKTFFSLNEHLVIYRENLDDILFVLSEPIWPTNNVLEQILRNISRYQNEDANMTNLAQNFTSYWNNWKLDELEPSAINAKEKLQKLLDNTEVIISITDEVNDSINSMYHDASHYDIYTGVFHTLANIQLWGNETEANMQQVIDIVEVVRNISRMYISNITQVKLSYSNAFNALLEISEKFNSKLEMDTNFLNRNFLVVNIFFTEVSIDRTVQNRAFDFWSMMSNLGGTCGLWLGFSITTGVEILSLLFRYFIYPFIRWIVDILDGDLDLLDKVDEKERRRRTKEHGNTENNKTINSSTHNGENLELKD